MREVMEPPRSVEELDKKIVELEEKIRDMVVEMETESPETQAALGKQIDDFKSRVEELKAAKHGDAT